MFFDYLKLIPAKNVVIFYGRSGSGKSTYAQFIKNRRDEYKVIDEVWSWKQLFSLWRESRKNKLVVCSHLPQKYYFFFRDKEFYDLDKFPEKLRLYLDEKGYRYSVASIERFQALFKTSMVDLEIILEQAESIDFDHELSRFLRTHHVIHRPDYAKAS